MQSSDNLPAVTVGFCVIISLVLYQMQRMHSTPQNHSQRLAGIREISRGATELEEKAGGEKRKGNGNLKPLL